MDTFPDPILISILSDIFASIAGSSRADIYHTVVRSSLPTLCNAIAGSKQDDYWVASSAIELATSLVNGAPQDNLGDGFFATLAPCLFECMDKSADRDVLQVRFTGFLKSVLLCMFAKLS